MLAQVILIIDSRKEIPHKYKKLIEHDSVSHCIISQDVNDSFANISEYEPDLIMISDNIDENIGEFCKKIRKITNSYRPVIVVLSKSSYLDDKLEALQCGADDFLSEPIDSAELTARISAHLRRHREELLNHLTNLPSPNITYKVLKRTVKTNQKWALMCLDIDNFKPYSEIYGQLASDKMLKTYAAILKSVVDKNDFLGHLNDDSFIILTSILKADKIATFMTYAFDTVANKFYTEDDAKRGYIILHGNEKAGRRIPIVSTSIGIIANEYKSFENYQEAANAVISLHKLAKLQPGSSWIIDRPQICGENAVQQESKKKLLIYEKDTALAYLLATTLEMQGYSTVTIENSEEISEILIKSDFNMAIIDTGNEEAEKVLAICKKIKDETKFANLKIIVSTIIHDKEKVLNTGVELYLPKPYELMTLFKWIEKFFEDKS